MSGGAVILVYTEWCAVLYVWWEKTLVVMSPSCSRVSFSVPTKCVCVCVCRLTLPRNCTGRGDKSRQCAGSSPLPEIVFIDLTLGSALLTPYVRSLIFVKI